MRIPNFFNVQSAVEFAHNDVLREWLSMRLQDRPDPIEQLDPEIYARRLGFDVQWVPEITGDLPHQQQEVIGIFDPQHCKIIVSLQYGFEAARFTIAHELGHMLLHGRRVVQHREFNPNGTRHIQQSRIEREANRFAAQFLMPNWLMRARIKESFYQDPPIIINEHIAYRLVGDNFGYLLAADSSDLRRELALSKCGRNFQNEQIIPLHAQFKVSKKAMAYRIKELGIVRV